ncbi:MAG: murein hydrolase activator EnvC family protein [Ruthenibacterium lactatiformans]|uniref:murein hydrolase activator EnvC family protein n=1 Tax=Ruthenibacterium lactatiformans TaxID=1550024 RepID=UPI003993984F
MEKHKKLVRVVCLVLAALMVMTIGVPLIFAYAETPAEKLERLRKELEDIKSNISAVENSKEKSEQTKQYYQAQANNLKAQLAAIKEDIAAQQQSIELKNAEVAEKAANVAYNKSMFESRLKGMYEMSRQSNLAILLGIDDVSQMLLFAENLQQISEHDTQLVQQLRDEQAALEAQRAELEQQLADLAAREQELTDTAVAYSNAIQQADAAISAAEADLAANEELWREPRGSTSRRRKNGGSGRRQTTWISSTIRAALPGLSRGIRTFPPISAWDAGSTASGTCTAAWMCRPRRVQKSMRLRTAW